MPLTKLPWQADEELGKKDDDHRLPEPGRFRPVQRSQFPRPRRLVVFVVAFFLFYQFFKHMPTDLAPAAERYNPTRPSPRPPNPASFQGSSQSSVALGKPENNEIHESPNYGESFDEEKIKFFHLAQSLPSQNHPKDEASNAVVFAGANLHSISDFLPLACRMSTNKLSEVHLVLLGRDEVSIEGIKQVNGISDDECALTWHDARPNNAPQSTHARMERAVVGGLRFIQEFIAPDVIITQRKDVEDQFFWNGLSVHKIESGIAHIALPGASRNMMWLANLQSHALRAWNDIEVHIVVHATQSSGALLRLVRSLDAADYLGFIPRLTIELPQLVESQTLESLQDLKLSHLQGHITIRRRIEPRRMDPAEASLRTVESFYPLKPSNTHLLLLSPQTELSPSFYHYLMYSILRYKQPLGVSSASSNLLGISLELPTSKPANGDAPFILPSSPLLDEIPDTKRSHIPTVLWQSPNSNAALYFGDKWVEFHSFLSSRLDSEGVPNTASKSKLVSKRYPAFMEYLLEMIHDKGYFMIYPAFAAHTASLATVHTEMYRFPEEFEDLPDATETDAEASSSEKPVSRESSITSLLANFESGLLDIDKLPLLSYEGKLLNPEERSTEGNTVLEYS